ncbi:hypothetical protein RRF57_002594 [Xylaria bambusicola]|uniref:Zn(2)-C6 fungal-type domain-containing protein n=1 Tax=Xylaria bambusicola TaxID=326684 RepID=A0AAN7UJ80_9PEZI
MVEKAMTEDFSVRCDGKKPSCKNCCEKNIKPCIYAIRESSPDDESLSPEDVQRAQMQGEWYAQQEPLSSWPIRTSGQVPPYISGQGMQRLQLRNYTYHAAAINAPRPSMGPPGYIPGQSSAAARAGYAAVPLMLADHTAINAQRSMGPPNFIPPQRSTAARAGHTEVPLLVVEDDGDPGWAAWVERYCASSDPGTDDTRATTRRRLA